MSVGFINIVRYWSLRGIIECRNEGRPVCFLRPFGGRLY